MAEAPLFSLILCTANTEGRRREIERLLVSLRAQEERDFEVIVVDQNPEFDITPLLAPHLGALRLFHIQAPRGLSRSRNRGLEIARGRYAAFPDDDCWYAPDILARVRDLFAEAPGRQAVHGRGSDPETGLDMARFDTAPGAVTLDKVMERSVSCGLFYRTEPLREIGGFDEALGLGSGTPWVGCEDYDLPIRMLLGGAEIEYRPDLVIYHPCPSLHYTAETVARAASQSPSFGLMLTRHPLGAVQAGKRLIRPLAGGALALFAGRGMKARYHWAAFSGRLRGAWAGRALRRATGLAAFPALPHLPQPAPLAQTKAR